ncbi:MAG: hypothetical protein ABJP45_13595 [Cyclobacteriaceae bacterium]
MPKISWLSKLKTKLTNWEYWPFSILYFPVFFYFGWLAIKARSIFFFTASNPSIDFGGMFGERKSEIFGTIPDKYLPKTELIEKGDFKLARDKAKGIGYPLIAKPDIGERGIWVSKVSSEEELDSYSQECPVDFLLQELVLLPIELGVFYIKYPGKTGQVTSIVRKEFLGVIGDGKTSIKQLLEKNTRAMLTADLSSNFLRERGDSIPKTGEEVLVEPIGNHCRGTKFLNDETEIDDRLTEAICQIADEIPDFYFGRFDLKCNSLEDLRDLKNFKILELNGAGAEPGHIYQPGYSLLQAYKDIFWHLRALAEISMLNHKGGIPYWSFKEGYQKWKNHKHHNMLLYKK